MEPAERSRFDAQVEAQQRKLITFALAAEFGLGTANTHIDLATVLPIPTL